MRKKINQTHIILGIVDRWKRESDELLVELENLCGKKWVNPYIPEKERFTLTLTDEERSLIEERIKAGYYSVMAHYKDSINNALKYIGAEPLASEWFWSSNESSQYNAWYVYFFIGDTGSYSKYGSGRVRAVIDF